MEGFVSLATKMGIGEAGITAIFGYLVVFVGLSLLMLVIYLIGAGKCKEKGSRCSSCYTRTGFRSRTRSTAEASCTGFCWPCKTV